MKKLILFILLLSIPNILKARELIVNSSWMHISGGVSTYTGYMVNLQYSLLLAPRLELGFSLTGQKASIKKDSYQIPLTELSAGITLSHILVAKREKSLTLWADLDLIAAYQILNNDSRYLTDGALLVNKSGFMLGVAPGVHLEIPLSRKTSFTIKIREKIMPIGQVSLLGSDALAGIIVRIK